MKYLTGTVEMFIHPKLKTPWVKGPKWKMEIPEGQTSEQVIKKYFTNGMERLVDQKIVEVEEKL